MYAIRSYYGQRQATPDPLEQWLAHRLLQQLELAADGLRGEVQYLCGFDDGAFSGNRPEIQQRNNFV